MKVGGVGLGLATQTREEWATTPVPCGSAGRWTERGYGEAF